MGLIHFFSGRRKFLVFSTCFIGSLILGKINEAFCGTQNKIDEEAKAFAFSIAWMKTIKQHNIANLSTAIKLERPANNGIHNIALDFVLDLVNKGKGALDIHSDIVRGLKCQA